jgi:hypothetical protein
LNDAREAGIPWKQWGPYLSERQWGTVREDDSQDGNAWDDFTHDQSRARAYRWGEDGLGGISDDHQRLCFALALWNGRDPILKERMFGLTNSQGNHGEDVKEYDFYVDSTPTHSYMKYLYKYPQREFPFKFLENFIWISYAMDKAGEQQDDMWDEQDGFYYDVLRMPDGQAFRLKVRSRVGLLPLCASTVLEANVGKNHPMTLFEVARDLTRRLSTSFLRDASGRRPVYGGCAKFQDDPHWRDLILFYEYFHGDNGAGLGASHQTGWTGLIARLLDLFARTTSEDALQTPKERLEARMVREQVRGN